jgi:hypothetical protein
VTYRVTFAAGAAAQYHDLPDPAQEALLARVVDLADAPWDDAIILPPSTEGDPAFREALFGASHGLLAFHVNDRDEAIRIFNIVWIS